MLARAALGVLATMCAMDATIAKNVSRAIPVEVAQRERCCDEPARPNAAETELIALAKKTLRKQLREPASAQFTMVSIKTAADGSTAVCGMVDSRNDTDGMTGPKPFVYDGRNLYILIASDGADNGTIHDGPFLDRVFERANEAHSKYCA
jgi:hypothetical protein